MALDSGWFRSTLVIATILVLTSCASRKTGPDGAVSTDTTPPPEPIAEVETPPPVEENENLPDAADELERLTVESQPPEKIDLKELPKVRYDAAHDGDIKEIMELAERGFLEQAELKAMALSEQYPNDPTLERIYNWVSDKRKLDRERAVEDKIREIDLARIAIQSHGQESADRSKGPWIDTTSAPA